MSESNYTIRAVARRTGLSPDVIRVWERRYNAVIPSRTATQRRVYGVDDVERLRLLRAAVQSGHGIGRIAQLPNEQLRELVGLGPGEGSTPSGAPQSFAEPYLAQCVAAVESMNAQQLEDSLARAAVNLGHPVIIDELMVPLMEKIDELWENGSLHIAHEHLASAVIRTFLSNLMRHVRIDEDAPAIVVTTPSGHLHEIGALMVAVTAAWEGWHVLYLGPNLPAVEILLAAQRSGARAIALSMVFPHRDSTVEKELKLLCRHLGKNVALLVGGRAVDSYSDVLEGIGAAQLQRMQDVRAKLSELRARSANRTAFGEPRKAGKMVRKEVRE